MKRALTWFGEIYFDIPDNQYNKKFEHVFNCKIVWDNDAPTHVEFPDELAYTWFTFHWIPNDRISSTT